MFDSTCARLHALLSRAHVRLRALLSRTLSSYARMATSCTVAPLALATCTLAIAAPAARAGRYHVYSCRMPDGQSAPTDGWTPSTSPASATVVASNTCASGGALVAALKDGLRHEVATEATWALAVPGTAQTSKLTLWRAGDTEGGAAQNATYQFAFSGPTKYEGFSECLYVMNCKRVGEAAEPLSLANILAVPTANLGSNLYMAASCGGLSGYLCPEGTKDANGYAAVVYLYAADLILEDAAQPSVGSVGGELATASKVSGIVNVTFEARDAGSGVYQAVVEVDEKVVGATVLDSNGGRCANVGQTSDGLAAFLYLQPCLPALSADVPLDTTSLSNGLHHVVVRVTDAAGNSTVVMDRKLEVANASASSSGGATSSSGGAAASGGRSIGSSGAGSSGIGAANGSPASALALLRVRWRSSAKPALASRWGRAQGIVGRLTTAGGAPIAGASLEVRATAAAQGAHASAVATVRTKGDGSFAVRLSPHASSGQIVVAYRAHVGDALPAAIGTLSLRVPASLSLRVAPRVSHAGGVIRFNGALRGGHIPAGGKQIVLQAHAPGSGWRTFEALSTDRRGRYRASYRFRLAGPITYRFRAVSRQEADFPFAAGSSNVVSVWER